MFTILTSLNKTVKVVIGIVLALALGFLIYRFRKKDDVDEESVQVLDQYGVPISEQAAFKKIAAQLAHDIGYIYGWADPRRWYENDAQIFENLRYLTALEYRLLEDLYPLYAPGRDLTSDVATTLDRRYIEQLDVIFN